MKADTEGMKNVAKLINENAAAFKALADELCEKIETEIGEGSEHATWNGPNAKVFATGFAAKKVEFDKAYKNLISCADNIISQANSWDTFEGNN